MDIRKNMIGKNYIHDEIIAALNISREDLFIFPNGDCLWFMLGDTQVLFKGDVDNEANYHYVIYTPFNPNYVIFDIFDLNGFSVKFRGDIKLMTAFVPVAYKLGVEGTGEFEEMLDMTKFTPSMHQKMEWKKEMETSLKNVRKALLTQ